MNKYKNKYRIPSARLQNWDYGANAAYFVTICTQGRVCYFGEIIECRDAKSCVSNEMQLSDIGKIAFECWIEIPQHFAFVKLGAYVVMPNHVHGIIIIDKPIETQTKNKFGPQSKNLASIIRGFKIGVTKNARQIDADFAWQSRFHDHIIRNDQSFQKISNYIEKNPLLWKTDKFHNS